MIRPLPAHPFYLFDHGNGTPDFSFSTALSFRCCFLVCPGSPLGGRMGPEIPRGLFTEGALWRGGRGKRRHGALRLLRQAARPMTERQDQKCFWLSEHSGEIQNHPQGFCPLAGAVQATAARGRRGDPPAAGVKIKSCQRPCPEGQTTKRFATFPQGPRRREQLCLSRRSGDGFPPLVIPCNGGASEGGFQRGKPRRGNRRHGLC